MAEDASMATAIASTSRPSAHTQRYDRQLRLWASSGQKSLESANILVLGGSQLGACVLKNLILPGIGTFTLVDGTRISDYDLGNNFFVTNDAKGQSRAKEVVKNLCELNPSVKGYAIDQDPMTFCTETPLDDYSLVIAVNQTHNVLLPLADKLWNANEGAGIPLMALRAAGFVGEVQVQVKETAGK
jgi:amyloid beta precursor protein binding protein 1